jgi:hypothetical protein
MKKQAFTHVGTLHGDARTANREVRVKLRLTPSGSHWVDIAGRRYRKSGGGYTGAAWPMYHLDADTIQEITASGMEAAKPAKRNGDCGSTEGNSPVPKADAQTPSKDSSNAR